MNYPSNPSKKTILTFIGFYLPGYKSGGPVRTISNILNLIGDEYNFKIITRDRDWKDEEPYEGIKSNDWNDGIKSKIFFSNKSSNIRKVIDNSEFDTYYLNSLFDFNFSIKIILFRKLKLIPQKEVIIAPRGELMDGALTIKGFKKKIYLILVKALNVYNNVIWHASTEAEAEEIKREMGTDIKTRIAMDVPDYSLLDIKIEREHKKEKGKLKILFISSIVPKKNLKFVIEVLNKVEGNFALDIYGPIKDKNYWKECMNEINPKIKNRITYKGEINNSEIHTIYPNYDLFFFPTLGENFGHVIWESLVFGCPVLTTDQIPWNGLENLSAGWNFRLNSFSDIKAKIEKLIALSDKEYSKYNKGCSYYIDNFDNEKTLRDNINLFE